MRKLFCGLILLGVLSTLAGAAAPGPKFLPASGNKLPRWTGFNLLEKFHRDWNNRPFVEEDFKIVRDWGFNFVRLPMDYRTWIVDGDWTRFNEKTLAEIDRAVAWGETYGVHVCINFHRAPGYTVASPPEAKSLWTDAEAQRVCALHWAEFARRYKGVPSARLSFNLFNEPADVEPQVYVAAVRPIVAAIRKEDPERLIVSDGLRWGQRPVLELVELGLAQATRGYTPADVTHYKASWMSGADQFPVPAWPRMKANGMLYHPQKEGLQAESRRPLVIEGRFEADTRLRMHVTTVSTQATLVVRADSRNVWEKKFVCGPGEGEWKKVNYLPQWKVYQNVYDRDYEAVVPAGARRVEIAVTDGDWLTLSEIGLKAGQREDVLTLRSDWDRSPAQVRYAPGARPAFSGSAMEDRRWLWDTTIAPWKAAEAKGIGVMVGEFGCHNQTPHDVVLAWMEDCLANWKEADWGWALWNLRGSFGVLDSGRADVQYEDFRGHQLDRKMLDLLKKYQ